MKAIIFDMDGTLVDSLMLWDVVWDTIGAKYCGGIRFVPAPVDEKAVRTLPLKTGMYYLQERYQLAPTAEDLYNTVNGCFGNFYSEEVNLKEGVREFLEECRNRGIKMCVASASAADLVDTALRHCGVREYFSDIFSCAVSGKGKEFPDIFLIAQEALGESITETWVAEDSIVALTTVAGTGMPTMGIYDRYNPDQAQMQNTATVYIGPGETMSKVFGFV